MVLTRSKRCRRVSKYRARARESSQRSSSRLLQAHGPLRARLIWQPPLDGLRTAPGARERCGKNTAVEQTATGAANDIASASQCGAGFEGRGERAGCKCDLDALCTGVVSRPAASSSRPAHRLRLMACSLGWRRGCGTAACRRCSIRSLRQPRRSARGNVALGQALDAVGAGIIWPGRGHLGDGLGRRAACVGVGQLRGGGRNDQRYADVCRREPGRCLVPGGGAAEVASAPALHTEARNRVSEPMVAPTTVLAVALGSARCWRLSRCLRSMDVVLAGRTLPAVLGRRLAGAAPVQAIAVILLLSSPRGAPLRICLRSVPSWFWRRYRSRRLVRARGPSRTRGGPRARVLLALQLVCAGSVLSSRGRGLEAVPPVPQFAEGLREPWRALRPVRTASAWRLRFGFVIGLAATVAARARAAYSVPSVCSRAESRTMTRGETD